MRDRPTLDLFLVSWLVLFLELACIRWFPSHVLFLTFFTNIVLLACFVGMSVGCLAAGTAPVPRPHPALARRRRRRRAAHRALSPRLLKYVAVGDRANPDVVFFGAEAGA